MDALPSHLVTPFHGPIPPSNLLDKIARGIAQAKGPVEWPFSLRATRVKLIEIARARSKDDSPNENDGPVPTPAKRRALYRQSSMDFIHESASEDHHGVESINRYVAVHYLPRSCTEIPAAFLPAFNVQQTA